MMLIAGLRVKLPAAVLSAVAASNSSVVSASTANTASASVLEALPLIDQQTAQRIIANRPYGNKEDQARGIGDILSEDILDSDPAGKMARFSAISNLITVRSDTYQIIATAQALRQGRVMAEKRISAVIER